LKKIFNKTWKEKKEERKFPQLPGNAFPRSPIFLPHKSRLKKTQLSRHFLMSVKISRTKTPRKKSNPKIYLPANLAIFSHSLFSTNIFFFIIRREKKIDLFGQRLKYK
jgi:hypothetical protein